MIRTKRILPIALLLAGGCKLAPTPKQINKAPEGFTALFNGKDLSGWQGLVPPKQKARLSPDQLAARQVKADKDILPHWTIRNDILHYDGKGDSLQTVKEFANFELRVDWKIGPNGDTGIYLRGTPQVQIWDVTDHPEGSGGLYNNKKNASKPLRCADRPIRQWNTFRIVMRGDTVNVWLNGELVVRDTPLENYWNRLRPLPAFGPIELQHHGNPLAFKNIFIKELD